MLFNGFPAGRLRPALIVDVEVAAKFILGILSFTEDDDSGILMNSLAFLALLRSWSNPPTDLKRPRGPSFAENTFSIAWWFSPTARLVVAVLLILSSGGGLDGVTGVTKWLFVKGTGPPDVTSCPLIGTESTRTCLSGGRGRSTWIHASFIVLGGESVVVSHSMSLSSCSSSNSNNSSFSAVLSVSLLPSRNILFVFLSPSEVESASGFRLWFSFPALCPLGTNSKLLAASSVSSEVPSPLGLTITPAPAGGSHVEVTSLCRNTSVSGKSSLSNFMSAPYAALELEFDLSESFLSDGSLPGGFFVACCWISNILLPAKGLEGSKNTFTFAAAFKLAIRGVRLCAREPPSKSTGVLSTYPGVGARRSNIDVCRARVRRVRLCSVKSFSLSNKGGLSTVFPTVCLSCTSMLSSVIGNFDAGQFA